MNAAKRKKLAASAFHGMTLHLEGRFSPEALVASMPWEPAIMGRRGCRPTYAVSRVSSPPLKHDYVKFDVTQGDLESSLRKFTSQVSRMKPEARAKFLQVRAKTLDIGLATPTGFFLCSWVISAPHMRRLAALGIELMVSVYPPSRSE